MDGIEKVINGAKKFINATKNTVKKAINFLKFMASVIGTYVGWSLFIIFIMILLYAVIKVGERALNNFFGEDWNYSTYEEDLTFIKDLYDSGYEAVISAENFQDFKAFEYAVLMDAAEYIRNNPKAIEWLPVGSETYQGKLADLSDPQGALDDLVKLGATARSVKVEDHYDIAANVESNNDRVTKPLLVYEFKVSTSNQSGDMTKENEGENNTTDELLKQGILKGSLEPYIYIIRDDINFFYWFWHEDNNLRVIEYSKELNAYNATLTFGREMSNIISQMAGDSGVTVEPDKSYGKIPYYTDNTTSVPMKIPLRTIIGRYMPKAELLQAWAILKQDIDEPDANKDDIVDELLTSIKGIYNEACLLNEGEIDVKINIKSGDQIEEFKEDYDTNKKQLEELNKKENVSVYKYADVDTDESTFVTFSTAGIESTQYGIRPFNEGRTGIEEGDKTNVTVVDDFVSAVHVTKNIMISYKKYYEVEEQRTNNVDGSPMFDLEGNPVMIKVTRSYTTQETLTPEEIATYVSSLTSGSYLPAGEPVSEGKYTPPTATTELQSGYYMLGEKDVNTVKKEILSALSSEFDSVKILTSDFLKYEPIFITKDVNISNKLKIEHHRMPVLLVDSATTWARKINYSHNIIQNKFEPDNKYYIIPSCASSMGLERFDTSLSSEDTYRGMAYRDIFARMKEKDVINTLMQLEYSAIEGSNDCYEYMRDVYKLLETAKEYSRTHVSSKASENIHENTYTYVYIPDSILKYDDSQTQKIYWLNLFSTGRGDEATKEELENMKTKDIDLTWQVVEYEKYPECNEGGTTKVYALNPFGSQYVRAYYQTVYELKGDDESIVAAGYEEGVHNACDWVR